MTKSIAETLAFEENRLSLLDIERKTLIENIQKLRKQLTVDTSESQDSNPPILSISQSAKITLFRCLFRGREDVYPKLWISKSGDRKGYMPACANDGNYSLCGKRKSPRVKCGDCNRQSYLPVSDEVIREHLQGKQTIGVCRKMLPVFFISAMALKDTSEDT